MKKKNVGPSAVALSPSCPCGRQRGSNPPQSMMTSLGSVQTDGRPFLCPDLSQEHPCIPVCLCHFIFQIVKEITIINDNIQKRLHSFGALLSPSEMQWIMGMRTGSCCFQSGATPRLRLLSPKAGTREGSSCGSRSWRLGNGRMWWWHVRGPLLAFLLHCTMTEAVTQRVRAASQLHCLPLPRKPPGN